MAFLCHLNGSINVNIMKTNKVCNLSVYLCTELVLHVCTLLAIATYSTQDESSRLTNILVKASGSPLHDC